VQKEGESLRKFIQCFCNKRNVIPEVDDKSIIMFVNKGLKQQGILGSNDDQAPTDFGLSWSGLHSTTRARIRHVEGVRVKSL
jgi:hypothetical protein